MQALYYSREKISKILNKRPISIISKNLLFISSVKFFLSLFERQKKIHNKSRQTEARNIRDIQPIMPLYFFSFFFFFRIPPSKNDESRKMVKIFNLLDHDKSRKDF